MNEDFIKTKLNEFEINLFCSLGGTITTIQIRKTKKLLYKILKEQEQHINNEIIKILDNIVKDHIGKTPEEAIKHIIKMLK